MWRSFSRRRLQRVSDFQHHTVKAGLGRACLALPLYQAVTLQCHVRSGQLHQETGKATGDPGNVPSWLPSQRAARCPGHGLFFTVHTPSKGIFHKIFNSHFLKMLTSDIYFPLNILLRIEVF